MTTHKWSTQWSTSLSGLHATMHGWHAFTGFPFKCTWGRICYIYTSSIFNRGEAACWYRNHFLLSLTCVQWWQHVKYIYALTCIKCVSVMLDHSHVIGSQSQLSTSVLLVPMQVPWLNSRNHTVSYKHARCMPGDEALLGPKGTWEHQIHINTHTHTHGYAGRSTTKAVD